MKKILLAVATLTALSFSQATFAALQNFTVTLDGAQDGGGGRTGSGSGTLTLDNVANTLTLNNITWSGLSANANNAHIHGPSGPDPAFAGVLYGLSPTYTTLGSTSGTISGTLPLVAGTGGFTIAEQISQLQSDLWYINVHSVAFGGGEIRGVIVPVPEPSTMALLGLGAGALVWRLRRKS